MARSRTQELGVGALLIGTLALLAYASVKVGAIRSFDPQIHASVVLEDAAGLSMGAPVKIAGVEIGTVTDMVVEGRQVRLSLSLDTDAGVRTDALAQVRARSALGEKFLALTPTDSQDAPLLQEGGQLTRTLPTTEIDQLVNAMGPLLAEVDPQALAQTIQALSDALAADPERLQRMLTDTETLLHNAALASADAPALVAEARGAAGAVQRLAEDGRPLARQAREALTHIDSAAAEAEGAVRDARAVAGDARAAIQQGQEILSLLNENADDIELIIDNVKQIDKWELRRLLREEGIRVRLRAHTVTPDDEAGSSAP